MQTCSSHWSKCCGYQDWQSTLGRCVDIFLNLLFFGNQHENSFNEMLIYEFYSIFKWRKHGFCCDSSSLCSTYGLEKWVILKYFIICDEKSIFWAWFSTLLLGALLIAFVASLSTSDFKSTVCCNEFDNDRHIDKFSVTNIFAHDFHVW